MKRSTRLKWIIVGTIGVWTASCCPAFAQGVAFTWDDLPAHSSLPPNQTRVAIAQAILTAMHDAHMPPAYGFVNGIQIRNEPASAPALDLWRSAGLPLGNHTWSHMNLNEHSVEEFENDIEKNEPLLQAKAGHSDWRWLRFPYLAEGDTPQKKIAVRTYLAQHGYRVAGVTMSFGDYAWNEPYARCIAKADQPAIASLEKSYLNAAAAALDYSSAMSKALFGHVIPLVLLMHVGAFDAHMLPRLLQLYREHGVTFLTLEEAERDPFYAFDTDLSLTSGTDSLEAAMAQRHLPLPTHDGLPDLSKVCR